jgi:Putative prokaryotic signal transducing protein
MDDRVCLRVFNYRHEAELARSALEAGGIPCFITADDAGGQGIGIQFTHGVRLWVSAQDLVRAVGILDATG